MVKEDVEAFRSNPFVGPGLQQVTWQVCSHILNKALRNRFVKKKWDRRPSSRRECFINPFSIVANVLFLPKRLARDSHNKSSFGSSLLFSALRILPWPLRPI